jgi:hypothetical protein
VKDTVPVLVISVVVLLVFACGCTMNTQKKAGYGNLSNEVSGKPTLPTFVPTGTESTVSPEPTVPVETIVSKMITIVPTVTERTVTKVPPTLADVCVFGSKNCHLYEQCMAGCINGGSSQTTCAKNICCSVKCMDLQTVDEKVACSNECRTGATGTTVPTLEPLSSPTETQAPLETATLVPL